MSRLYWISAGIGLTVTEICRAAHEQVGAEAESPSLFGGSMWTSLLTLIIFFLLLVILGKYAWKPLLDALNQREERIRSDLHRAKMERQEAEKILADLKQQLSGAQMQVEEMLKKSAVDAEHQREAILSQAQEQAKNTLDQAKVQIEQAKQEAVKDIYAKSVEIAGSLAAKILQREVNSEDHRVLIQQGLNELSKKN